MKNLKPIKRGDTFSFVATITNQAGVAILGATQQLKCQVRDSSDKLFADLTITETETPGSYLFKADSTGTWPVGGTLYLDIKYTNAGVTSSSETLAVLVEKDVTK